MALYRQRHIEIASTAATANACQVMMKVAILMLVLFAAVARSSGDLIIGPHKQVCKPVQFSSVPVKMPGCAAARIPLKQCVGTCLSISAYPSSNGFRELCKCCKPVMWKDRQIQLECANPFNGARVVGMYTIREAVACACTPCDSSRRK